MSAWDLAIFAEDTNEEFLDELLDLDDDVIVESVRDACLLAVNQPEVSEVERANGLAAATIAAIWAGAPFAAGDTAETYPYIRELTGSGDAVLSEAALELLEGEDTEHDIDQFIEALS